MKVDIESSMDEFRRGLFSGKVNRFVSKITISMDQEEVSRFLRFTQLNNLDDSSFFNYDAFVPGGEELDLGRILTKWVTKGLSKKGTYVHEFYSQTANDRETVQRDYLDLWKNIKASLESADTLAETTKTAVAPLV